MEASVPARSRQGEEVEDLGVVRSNDIPRAIVRNVASATESADLFLEATNLTTVVNALSSTEADDIASISRIKNLKNSGKRLRLATEIVKENLAQCIELMKYFELFHVNMLRGNFLLKDEREYVGFLFESQGNAAGKIVRAENQSFVGSQLFMLNAVMASAVPARQRFSEIVKGASNEFMETIRDPAKIKSLITELVSSAIYEICILFSTKRSLDIALQESIIDALESAGQRGVQVKVLVMYKDAKVMSDEVAKEKTKTKYPSIIINYLQQFLPTKITTLIIDQAKSLAVEVNDDSKDSLEASVGLSTYSNSESTVFSNASIFESLWIQSELDKQNKARQVYFQLFKGFKLKNEVYERKWSESGVTEDDSTKQAS